MRGVGGGPETEIVPLALGAIVLLRSDKSIMMIIKPQGFVKKKFLTSLVLITALKL